MLPWSRVLAAVVSGGLLGLISAPVNLHWIAWFSLVPLFWALKGDDSPGNAVLGYLAGYAAVYACFYWLAETVVRFSNLSPMLSIFTLHLYCAVYALPYALVFGLAHPLRRRLGVWWIVLVPALQVVNEYLTPVLFPYNWGAPQYRVLWVWQIASITGVYGVSFLVFLSNCVLAEVLYRHREGRPAPWKPLAWVASVLALNLAFGAWRVGAVDRMLEASPTLRVAMLQQSITMAQRFEQSSKAAIESWFKMTARVKDQGVDLVVWPEGASPYNPHEGNLKKILSEMTSEGNYNLLLGGGTRDISQDSVTGKRSVTWYNSCYLFDRKGELRDRYDKMVPLPFGEYLPFASHFPFLYELIQGPGSFRAGTRPTIFQTDTFTFATPICYEAILPRIERKLKAADVFINITNDAWFGTTAAPHQHAMLAVTRAVEFGRPMIRVAYTGVNMIVEPTGRITYETWPFIERADVVTMRIGKVDTIYWRFGDWFPFTCLAGVLLAGVLSWRVGRKLPSA